MNTRALKNMRNQALVFTGIITTFFALVWGYINLYFYVGNTFFTTTVNLESGISYPEVEWGKTFFVMVVVPIGTLFISAFLEQWYLEEVKACQKKEK